MRQAIFVIVLAGSMLQATAARRTDESDHEIETAIAAFDRCVQVRFSEINPGFGLTRVATYAHKLHSFVPRTEPERESVRSFETLGLRVVLYLAGFQRPRSEGPGGGGFTPVSPVQGPVIVNPVPKTELAPPAWTIRLPGVRSVDRPELAGLPGDADVTKAALSSLVALTEGASYSFDIGRWRVAARPVRATAVSCLGCHNWRPKGTTGEPFKLGDPIGAVLYAYQPVPTSVRDSRESLVGGADRKSGASIQRAVR